MSATAEFNILPHPAKTNNPADLISEPGTQGGLQGAGPNAYNAKGPHVPDQAIAEGLEKPKTRDEVSLRGFGRVLEFTLTWFIIAQSRGCEVERVKGRLWRTKVTER